MLIFILGLILFFGVHSISIVNASWRDRMADKIGVWPWKGIYSLPALAGLILLIYGYGLVRTTSPVIYGSTPWLIHLTMLLMLPVFPLLLATYLPGRISSLARHPMLIATIIWAFAHLLVNGRVADLLLFGAFLIWAALDLLSMRWRQERPVPTAPESNLNDVIAVAGGLAIYLIFFLGLHSILFGVHVM